MRSIPSLTIVTVAALALGAVVAYAQTTTPQSQSSCGIETWSTDKQTYVTVPCNSADTQQAKAPAAGGSNNTTNCGIETWSTDKQMYVTTPCVGGTTEENPAGASK